MNRSPQPKYKIGDVVIFYGVGIKAVGTIVNIFPGYNYVRYGVVSNSFVFSWETCNEVYESDIIIKVTDQNIISLVQESN